MIRIHGVHTSSLTGTTVIAFLMILVASCNGSQQSDTGASADNVFATIQYDKVIAYDYNGEGDIEIIDEQGHLAKD